MSIHDSDGLHQAIGRWLINLPKRITGAEFRYLRLHLDLSQRAVAALIGSEEQTVRRWEKARAKAVPGPADRLIRVLYAASIGKNGELEALIRRLAELDAGDCAEARLREDEGGWRMAA